MDLYGRIDAAARRTLQQQCDAKLAAQCKKDEEGNLIRGQVRKIKCSACGLERWDDGTRCKNPICKVYTRAHQNMAEDQAL